MLRWTISAAFNRLLMVAVFMLFLRAYGPSSCRATSPLEEWISAITPLDKVVRALRAQGL